MLFYVRRNVVVNFSQQNSTCEVHYNTCVRTCVSVHACECMIIMPRAEAYGSSLTLGTKGYGSRFVVRSFVRSVHCATESSAHFFAPVKVRTG